MQFVDRALARRLESDIAEFVRENDPVARPLSGVQRRQA